MVNGSKIVPNSDELDLHHSKLTYLLLDVSLFNQSLHMQGKSEVDTGFKKCPDKKISTKKSIYKPLPVKDLQIVDLFSYTNIFYRDLKFMRYPNNDTAFGCPV